MGVKRADQHDEALSVEPGGKPLDAANLYGPIRLAIAQSVVEHRPHDIAVNDDKSRTSRLQHIDQGAAKGALTGAREACNPNNHLFLTASGLWRACEAIKKRLRSVNRAFKP